MNRALPLQQGHLSKVRFGTVVALVLGPVERARIAEALRGRQLVRFIDRVDDLMKVLSDVDGRVTNVIIEARDVECRPTAEAVSLLRRSRPAIPVVGYCRVGLAHSAEIRELSIAGVNELLFSGVDDTGSALRAVLSAACQASVGETVAAALTGVVPPRLWPFVRHVAMHPNEAKQVSSVAKALGYHRRTLVNHCAEAQLPPPQELIAWCRLAVVGQLLGTTQHTIEAIALQLDFPSDTALRNLMKRYVGQRAGVVRETGGLLRVLSALECAIAVQRQTSAPLSSATEQNEPGSRSGTA
jgi:AraC-like DNA-binding protein